MSIPRVVVFDLDKTFASIDTLDTFLIYLKEINWMDNADAFFAGCEEIHQKYASGDPSFDPLESQAFIATIFLNRPYSEVQEAAKAAVKKVILKKVYPEMIEILKKYKKEGYITLMISASFDFFIKEIGKLFPFDDSLGTKLQLNEDKTEIIGLHPEGTAMGEGKVRLLREYLEEKGFSLEEVLPTIVFYSDSIRDLPLLSIVGHPHAVDPDTFLEEKAKKLNWPIHKFPKP